MHGHAVMGEQGVQERAENAPLWGPSVKDQRGLHGGVETQGLELDDEFGGYYGVKCLAVVDEQHSHIGIPLVQMG